jgi:FAD/FMN-containing dehydrogenase
MLKMVGFLAGAAAGTAAGVGAFVWSAASRRQRERRTVASETMTFRESEEQHAGKVARIAAQLRARKSTRPVSLRKRAVSHVVPKRSDRRLTDEKIDISDLTTILDVDPHKRVCVAEPGVTFFDLVAATMRHGLVPIVVPELKTITVGGAVSGCSIESMSFRYGGFHDTCLEYEVITASGEVLVCTPDNENKLVFEMMHGSFGTLGILSKLTFRLVPAKPFVHVTYEKYGSVREYMDAIRARAADPDIDFMDGIVHSPAECVLSIGRFVDYAPYANQYYWTKVYYRTTRERTEDYLRTPDYFWRYDTGVTNPTPKSAIGRLFLGKVLGSSQLLRLAQKLPFLLSAKRPNVTLDVFVPLRKMDEFLSWYEREFQYFPLWCVPYRRVKDYAWVQEKWYEGVQDDMFVDLAIYGMKQRGDRNYYKLMEEELMEIGGIKTLISHNYYSEEDFWKTWNKAHYDQVKARTDPHNIFRDLYTKTCKAAMGAPV